MDILHPYMSMNDQAEFEKLLVGFSRYDDPIETLIATVYDKQEALVDTKNRLKGISDMESMTDDVWRAVEDIIDDLYRYT